MFKKYFLFFSTIIILNFSFKNVRAIENKIIVKINESIITSYELKNKLKTSLILSNQEINQSNIDKNKSRALSYLIDLEIKKNELKKYDVKIDSLNVNDQLLSISSNDINDFKKKFQKLGINFDLFVYELKIETGWKQLMYKIYNKKVKISNDEIDKQVLSFIKEKSKVTEFKISEIEINLEKNINYENEVDFIKKEINENGFENTALKFSTSMSSKDFGNIGWINKESLTPRVSKILDNLKIGEVSPPIKNLNTLLFLKLTDLRITKVNEINLEELKKKIINQKKNELFALFSRSHLSKLKNNSLIEYK